MTREAKFIGNLFINTASEKSKKPGATYLKGTLDINGQKVAVYGHFVQTTAKSGNNAGQEVQYFAIEDTTESDMTKSVQSKSASAPKATRLKFYEVNNERYISMVKTYIYNGFK